MVVAACSLCRVRRPRALGVVRVDTAPGPPAIGPVKSRLRRPPPPRDQHHNPRYTGMFSNVIEDGEDGEVNEADKREGWDIVPDPRRPPHGKMWIRRNGAGMPMTTWEVRCGRMCVRVCVHVRMCACVHVRMCACAHVRMSSCVWVCMCAGVHVCGCACVRVCLRVCTGWVTPSSTQVISTRNIASYQMHANPAYTTIAVLMEDSKDKVRMRV